MENEKKFNKRSILRSVKWSKYVDLIEPYLNDTDFYTESELDEILKKYKIKRRV